MQGRLNLAARIEGHPDNTAACTLGGVTVSSLVGSRVMWAKVPLPRELRALVVVPGFGVPTGVARNVLPGSVLHADATFNVSRVALWWLLCAPGCMKICDMRQRTSCISRTVLRWCRDARCHTFGL